MASSDSITDRKPLTETVVQYTTVTPSMTQTSNEDILQSSPTPSAAELSLPSDHPARSRVTAYATEITSDRDITSFNSDTTIPRKTLLISENRDSTEKYTGQTMSEGLTIVSTELPNETLSGKYPLNWPFISGLIIGAILLVLIAIVSILLILVVCVRRREDSDDFTTKKSENPFNVVSPTPTDLNQGESSFPMLGKLHPLQ